MKKLILTLSVFLSFAAVAEPAHEVRCREIAFSVSAEMRDATLFASFIDDDARFIGTTVNRGPAAITEAWKVFFADGGPEIKWRPQFVELLEDGKLALTRGPYRTISTNEDGNVNEHWGTFNSVWRMQADGKWKVVFDAGSAASEPPADDVRALLDEANDCEL